MAWGNIRRFITLGLAAAVLAITLAARVPNTRCHCNDRRDRAQKDSAPCPFGMLRSFSGNLGASTPARVAPAEPRVTHVAFQQHKYVPRVAAESQVGSGIPPRGPPPA